MSSALWATGPIHGAGDARVGAGGADVWRRCGFWVGTCAAKWACGRSSGAGITPFSTPAPRTPRTCATSACDLRHEPPTPAPQSWGRGFGGPVVRVGWSGSGWNGGVGVVGVGVVGAARQCHVMCVGRPLGGGAGWFFSRGWVFWQKVCIFAGRERRRPGFGRRLLFSRAAANVRSTSQ